MPSNPLAAGSNPAPALRDFTSDFKSIKDFNTRTRKTKKDMVG